MRWFWDLLQRYIDWSRDASGIANAIQIATPVLTIGGATIGLARALARRMLRDKEAEIYLLKKDLDRKARDLVEVTSERNQWDRRCVDLQERLAETALDRANIERSEGQHPRPTAFLRDGSRLKGKLFPGSSFAVPHGRRPMRRGNCGPWAYWPPKLTQLRLWLSGHPIAMLLAYWPTLRRSGSKRVKTRHRYVRRCRYCQTAPWKYSMRTLLIKPIKRRERRAAD